MDRTSKVLVPSIEVIIDINREFIVSSGEEYVGRDNLLNRNSLEYILEEIVEATFGRESFPGLFHKAATIAERIIISHVFYGANKRTGLATCAVFLELNGWRMDIFDDDRFDEEAIKTVMQFQNREISLVEFTQWVRSPCTKIDLPGADEMYE